MSQFGFVWHATRYLMAALTGIFLALCIVTVAVLEGWFQPN